jgi:periplasmic divalent cation tolerance protein
MRPIIVLCTCKEAETKKIVDALLVKKLVACVNICPVNSFFWWGGKVTGENEALLIMKSFWKKWDEIQTVIKDTHSYEIPEIISLPIEGCSPRFLQWMESVVK